MKGFTMKLQAPGRVNPAGISWRRSLIVLIMAFTLGVGLPSAAGGGGMGGGMGGGHRHDDVLPTVVLVHGAFADASGWAGVIEELQKDGYPVIAPPNPLRGIHEDADYLRSFLTTISGPVILVGHSYAGATITNAATGNPNVEALVYLSAYLPAEGETLAEAGALGGGSTDLGNHLIERPYPGGPEGDVDLYVDPLFVHGLFAQDLSAREAAILAATQRPFTASALSTPSGVPAWLTIPSWAIIPTDDRSLSPIAEKAMAERAGATIVSIESSHVVMISHPKEVSDVIRTAAESTGD
jgi:pimeloyl-ACP methyl ester carboxylesterase